MQASTCCASAHEVRRMAKARITRTIGDDFVFIVRQVDRLFVYQIAEDADFYFKASAFSELKNIQNLNFPESVHPPPISNYSTVTDLARFRG